MFRWFTASLMSTHPDAKGIDQHRRHGTESNHCTRPDINWLDYDKPTFLRWGGSIHWMTPAKR